MSPYSLYRYYSVNSICNLSTRKLRARNIYSTPLADNLTVVEVDTKYMVLRVIYDYDERGLGINLQTMLPTLGNDNQLHRHYGLIK